MPDTHNCPILLQTHMAKHELEKTLWAAADILKIAGAYHTWRTQLDARTEWYMGQHDVAETGELALLLDGENQLSEEFLSKKKGGGE